MHFFPRKLQCVGTYDINTKMFQNFFASTALNLILLTVSALTVHVIKEKTLLCLYYFLKLTDFNLQSEAKKNHH